MQHSEGRPYGLADIYRKIELPCVPVLADMELRGVLVDKAALHKLTVELARDALDLAEQLSEKGLSDPNSPKKVGEALKVLGVPLKKRTPTGQLSTDKKILEELRADWPVVDNLLNYRERVKLISTYTAKIPKLLDEGGRLHGSFNQGGHWEEAGGDSAAAPGTGRISSSGPNLQNIPKHGRYGDAIRRAFVAPRGRRLVRADIGQEEARIGALLSGDEALVRAFNAGEDPYLSIGELVFGRQITKKDVLERQVAKTFFLAKLYGAAIHKLATVNAGGLYVPKGRAGIASKMFDDRYPGIADYARRINAFALDHGYVETYYGRRRYLPGIFSKRRKEHEDALRQAVNAPIQGTGADLMKLALRVVWEQLRETDAFLVLTVHDELVVESAVEAVPTVVDILNRMLEPIDFPIALPVDVTVGATWAGKEAE